MLENLKMIPLTVILKSPTELEIRRVPEYFFIINCHNIYVSEIFKNRGKFFTKISTSTNKI